MPRVKWNTLTALLPKSIHHLRSDSPVTDFGTYILECIIYVQAMTSYNLIMNCSLHHTGMKKFPNLNLTTTVWLQTVTVTWSYICIISYFSHGAMWFLYAVYWRPPDGRGASIFLWMSCITFALDSKNRKQAIHTVTLWASEKAATWSQLCNHSTKV